MNKHCFNILLFALIAQLTQISNANELPSAAISSTTSSESNKTGASDFQTVDRTQIDFDEAYIDGKMMAPTGFYLQGKKPQVMTLMVKLRSNFRDEIRRSRAGVANKR